MWPLHGSLSFCHEPTDHPRDRFVLTGHQPDQILLIRWIRPARAFRFRCQRDDTKHACEAGEDFGFHGVWVLMEQTHAGASCCTRSGIIRRSHPPNKVLYAQFLPHRWCASQAPEHSRLRRRVGLQHVLRNHLKRPLMGGGKDHWRRDARIHRIQPAGRTYAPAVARSQAWKIPLRPGRAQIVASNPTVGQKLGRYLHAHGVLADVLRAGVAGSVAEKSGQGLVAARFQRAAKHIACVFGHASTGASDRAQSQIQTRAGRLC